MDLGSYFAMDGYAWFVWPSWIISIATLAGLYIWSVKQLKARERKLAQAREQLRS